MTYNVYSDPNIQQMQSVYNLSLRKLVMQLLPLSITIMNSKLQGMSPSITQEVSRLTDKDVVITITEIDTSLYNVNYIADVYDIDMVKISDDSMKIKVHELPILLRECYKINDINYRGVS